MHFQQFFLSCLAQASYFIGSEGEAVVVDPQRDVELYINEASEHGFTIKYVIETHLHADFVSGHQELAERTGAQIYLGARANATFPHVDVRDGDELRVGKVRLRFLETPGHTLESISIVITDEEGANEPAAVLTGDTLFIGDVGRPDLGGEPRELAGLLYDSLHQKLLALADSVAVYPAHGAGSLCGRAISEDRSSTIGRERRTNYALQAASKAEFIDLLTAELPERPQYFNRDVELNRAGAGSLADLVPLREMRAEEVLAAQRAGAIVLDVRNEDAFGAAHVRDAVNIGLGGQFASWAGIMLGLEVDLILLGASDDQTQEVRTRLARVGIESVIGYIPGGIDAWCAARGPCASIEQLEPREFAVRVAHDHALQVIDVRRPAEWSADHMAGAQHLPLNRLLTLVDALDRARPVAVYCKGGYRSSMAASFLQREGFSNVVNLRGGFDAWIEAGLQPVGV